MTKKKETCTKKCEKIVKKPAKPAKDKVQFLTFKDDAGKISVEGHCRSDFFANCAVFLMSILDEEDFIKASCIILSKRVSKLNKNCD